MPAQALVEVGTNKNSHRGGEVVWLILAALLYQQGDKPVVVEEIIIYRQ
ncbi:hypothetical protein QUB80_03485 [Chlorogloeopsis sp. ULAP01]|nr:hypothetical protein [Chlorogloeopsis sp. ULAP01]MDM9379761.1 hypothetical protein [Chlorogloeopsis sp. ULAP01]